MDESKLVDKIGAFHLPVEIAQYGSKQAMERMAAYGWNPVPVSYTHLWALSARQPASSCWDRSMQASAAACAASCADAIC